MCSLFYCFFFFFQAEDGIRDATVTGVQTCALPICLQLERSTAFIQNPLRRPTALTHRKSDSLWLRRQRFQSGPLAIVFDECYSRMFDAKTRRDALDKAITELAAAPPYVDVVERLVCLRGVSTLTAFALTVELGDWNRFRPTSL